MLAGCPGGRQRPDDRTRVRSYRSYLHDVVDERQPLDADSITTSDLVAFFEYLVSNGWHAITLDEIERAGRGETALPEKSILITVDDAYASDYTRLYPLLLATNARGRRGAGGVDGRAAQDPQGRSRSSRGRRRARCRRAASSSSRRTATSCTRAIRGNPQASQLPAFAFRIFDPARGYEDDDEYRRRVTMTCSSRSR